MTKKLKYIIGFCMFISSCTDSIESGNDILNYKYKEVDGALIDTVKTTFHLNGERVLYHAISSLSSEDQARMSGSGATKTKKAIKMYGEKYRNGIVLFEIK